MNITCSLSLPACLCIYYTILVNKLAKSTKLHMLVSAFYMLLCQSLQPFTYLFHTVALTICILSVLFPYLCKFIVWNIH